MPRRPEPARPAPADHIVDIDVTSEMQGSFLEYAYSVIYSRALPDARDGLKPVQRRILYTMHEMGLRNDRGHVKSARVVGEVMGRLHPHGDSAIYDALVRMAQPFSLRLPLVDGHGNFGSPDDGPAAYRYTECRLAAAAAPMVEGLDEEVVDFGPNYDGREEEPQVLPAAFPNLLVNGASGIAVGMATNMPPHNLGEVVAAARHLLADPDASLEELMRFIPGPDLPTGGRITGLAGIREAYETGRGSFRMRATARVEQVTPRRAGLVITEMPWNVGAEKVTEKIRELHNAKKITGIADVTDLTDGDKGLHLLIELKAGFLPEAMLEQLYRMTPLEETFGINNVCLVEGQPRTLGLKALLEVYVTHRLEVLTRRTRYRRNKAAERLHLVDGLLIAIVDIDEVIAAIRASDDTGAARARLMSVFDLSEVQANYILEMPLRRLTKYSRIELESERDELRNSLVELDELLGDDHALRGLASAELAEMAGQFATPRRTVLLEGSAVTPRNAPTVPLEVVDEPCEVLLSSTGLIARRVGAASVEVPTPPGPDLARGTHDVVISRTSATTRGYVGVLSASGSVQRVHVLDLPSLPVTAPPTSLGGGATVGAFVPNREDRVIGLVSLLPTAPTLALATAAGQIKRVAPEPAPNKDEWSVIRLEAGDAVVGAAEVTDDAELVLLTSDAQLLRFPAADVRPQGRPAAGMRGVKLSVGSEVIAFAAWLPERPGVVVTVAGDRDSLFAAGTTWKVTSGAVFPGKGRGTGGVRAHRFLKGENALVAGWVTGWPAVAATATGEPVNLPEPDQRRDGSGVPSPAVITAVAEIL
ncbi:MAG: DNA gyrase/topoisomerase IV subunit A [Candidatus Nanopelagicales bacterium]